MKIGIDIGGSHIGIGVVNRYGKIVQKKEIRILKENKNNVENFIEEFLVENIKTYTDKYKIESIGISSAGRIKNNIILHAANLGFQNYNIVKKLKDKLNKDIDIFVKNDAICAAMAEKQYGILMEKENAMFMVLGTGIGGTIIKDNKIIKQEDVNYISFGHIMLKEKGIKCNCGKIGCFERYASIKVLKDNLRQRLGLDKYISGEKIVEIIRQNPDNKIIKSTIDEYINNLVEGILILTDIFNINYIVLGGGFVYYKDFLLEKLENELYKRNKINVTISKLGNDAGIIGATLI